MKNFVATVATTLLVIAAVGTTAAAADSYAIDTAHSNVGFTVRHMMVSNVHGQFNTYTADLNIDAKDLTQSSASASVEIASLDTDNAKRDEHLRSADFFDAAQFPQMKFETVAIRKDGSRYIADANLTIKGTTRKVPFSVDFYGIGKDPMGNTKAGFSASATIKRSDFGLSWNKTLETGGLLVGDEVNITLDIEANKK